MYSQRLIQQIYSRRASSSPQTRLRVCMYTVGLEGDQADGHIAMDITFGDKTNKTITCMCVKMGSS